MRVILVMLALSACARSQPPAVPPPSPSHGKPLPLRRVVVAPDPVEVLPLVEIPVPVVVEWETARRQVFENPTDQGVEEYLTESQALMDDMERRGAP